ncbi:hypothetical protein M5689_003775 [Euphorbia peplus]|nr:hypothetical protein M5689_003775 [Euphorbia peplus]
MFVGEAAIFVAYVNAPPVFVTPLGALTLIVSAILAHFMLRKRLQRCVSLAVCLALWTNILVYLGIWSLAGSVTVVSIKAIGIAIKLTLEGTSQIGYPQTWFFLTVAVVCVITQFNDLNKWSKNLYAGAAGSQSQTMNQE